jgi:hypothetical protein
MQGYSIMINTTIIASNCTGAYLYKYSNKPFTNPFMWSLLSYNDMISLITKLSSINFNHIIPPKDPVKIPRIIIDNKVSVLYPHINLDIKANTPYKNNGNIYTSIPAKYAIEKYYTRINRWSSLNARPCFVIGEDKKWTSEAININDIERLLPQIENTTFDVYIFTMTQRIAYEGNNAHIKIFNIAGPQRPHELARYILDNNILAV